MSSVWSRIESPTGRLVVVSVLASTLTASVIFGGQQLRRRTIRKHIRDDVEAHADDDDELTDFTATKTTSTASTKGTKNKKTSDVIINEALARNYVFFGDEGMAKIRKSFVVVVGVGGVGSAAATMLVRSGVNKIRIIDFDQVSLSSLNRHASATLAQVGTPKVSSCADYFNAIAPWVTVDPRISLFGKENAAELLADDPDFVIDSIDNIESKVQLLAYCHKNKIPVFSALGAGAKSDPSRIQIADISETREDQLAKAVRRRLKIEHNILNGIPVVYSTERPRPDIGLLPLPEEEFQKGKVGELSALANFRVRILPVLGPLPAMFGNAAACYALQSIAGFKMAPLAYKNQLKVAKDMMNKLYVQELSIFGIPRLPFSEEDIIYIYDEVNKGRSVVPPHAVSQRPCIMRWDKRKGLTFENMVSFDKEDGIKHEEHCLRGDEDPAVYWGKEAAKVAEKRAAEERQFGKFRDL